MYKMLKVIMPPFKSFFNTLSTIEKQELKTCIFVLNLCADIINSNPLNFTLQLVNAAILKGQKAFNSNSILVSLKSNFIL